ncbi:MAG: translocation/assembly module TamB domain-containing protein [Armatimonadetes bacterium]|nr:translocation/assembly module TamB domain-containing protein [Armatimonadota bacterium]
MANRLNGIVRTGARLVVFAITGLTFLCAVVVLLTQLPAFRSWAVEQALAAVNETLVGAIETGEVTGNLLTGLTIHNVRLKSGDSTTILEAPAIALRYQITPILESKTIRAQALIERPVIQLIRSANDSVWNIAKFAKPSTDTTPSKPFDWTINLETVEIRDASFIMDDRTAPRSPDTSAVDFSHLRMEDFHLVVSADVDPVEQHLAIRHLSGRLVSPYFRIVELAAAIDVDESGLTLDDFYLQTDRSLLTLDAHLDSVNFLGPTPRFDHEGSPFRLVLNAKRASMDDLKQFVPNVGFLAGAPAFSTTISGTYDDIFISNARLTLQHSDLKFGGRMKNLRNPEQLYLQANITDSKLSNRDGSIYAPGLELPDLGYVGDAELRTVTFAGQPNNFTATIDATTASGAVTGGVMLDMRRPAMRYIGDLAIVHGNLAKVMADSAFRSDFTGRAVINGQGVELKDLDARVRIESQGSMVAGRRYRKLYLDATARNGGVLTLDTLMVAWGAGGTAATSKPEVSDSAVTPQFMEQSVQTVLAAPLRLSAQDQQMFASGQYFGVGGMIDFRNSNDPIYNVSANGRQLNLEEILLNPAYRSRLNLSIAASGHGFNPDLAETNGQLRLETSEYNQQSLPGVNGTFKLTRPDARRRTFIFNSEVADVSLKGEWKFSTIAPAMQDALQGIMRYVETRANYGEQPTITNHPTEHVVETVNASFSLNLKDLKPIQPLLGSMKITMTGLIDGGIIATPSGVEINANGGINGTYQQDSTNITLNNVKLSLGLSGIEIAGASKGLRGEVRVSSDSSIQFGEMFFHRPAVNITLSDQLFRIGGRTQVDSTMYVSVAGAIDARDPAGYQVQLDTMLFLYGRDLKARNVGPIRALVGPTSMRADSMAIRVNDGDIVSIKGGFLTEAMGFREVTVDYITVQMQNPNDTTNATLMNFQAGQSIGLIQRSLERMHVTLNGTMESPIIAAEAEVSLQDILDERAGKLWATLNYRDRNLVGQMQIRSGADTLQMKDTLANIVIDALPIDLAFASRTERFISGQLLKITAQTKRFPLEIVAPFVPGVQIRKGRADVNFSVAGNYPELDYRGAGLVEATGVLEGNNLAYYFRLPLQFKDQVLSIDSAVIRNDPRDLPGGIGYMSATAKFDGFQVSRIDAQIRTPQLMILSDASQAVNDFIYGDLVISTGDGYLTFDGSLDSPALSGPVIIERGNLQIPYSESGASINATGVRYVSKEEWEAEQSQPYGPDFGFGEEEATAPTEADSSQQAQEERLRRELQQRGSVPTAVAPSFVDRLNLDLAIRFPNRTNPLYVTMDLGAATQQLRAQITDNGFPLYVRQEAGKMTADGSLEILSGSKFIYIKSFNASGDLVFDGDLGNPGISITAVYEGRRVTSAGQNERYSVTIDITGTKERPTINFRYAINGFEQSVGDPDDRTRNAISLLLFGKTTDELRGAGATSQLSDLLNNSINSYGSAALGTFLTEALGSDGVIQSIDIELGQLSDIGGARINFVSQFGPVLLRYGGTVSDPTNGAITVDLPADALLDTEFAHYLFLQLQRSVESSSATTTASTTATDPADIYRVRVQFRKSW